LKTFENEASFPVHLIHRKAVSADCSNAATSFGNLSLRGGPMTMTARSVAFLAARIWRGIILISAAAVAVAIVGAVAADAQGRNYDGSWNVVITTTVGSCISPYSVQIRIAGGRVLGEGTGAQVSGSVSQGGNITVQVSSGDSKGSGSGRLGPGFGSGRWSGRGSAGFCRGRWEARRSYS
jgi:hypothetical protein